MRKTQINKILKNTAYNDFIDFIKKDIVTRDELIDLIKTYSSEKEITYYSNAMDYLKEHDTSLGNSLDLADSLGYELKDLNSEFLANLLLRDTITNDLTNLLIK